MLAENARNVMVVRGAMVKQNVPRTFCVPASVQAHIIRSLGFKEDEYLAMIPVPSKAFVN